MQCPLRSSTPWILSLDSLSFSLICQVCLLSKVKEYSCLRQEGRSYLPIITHFCEVFKDSGLICPAGLFDTVRGEPGHFSSLLTLSGCVTLDKTPSLGRLDQVISTLPAVTSHEAMKRGKYMNRKIERDCTCFIGSGEVLGQLTRSGGRLQWKLLALESPFTDD